MAPFSPGTTRLRVRTGPKRQLVSALRGRADLVIDTSLLNAADLKCSLIGHVAFDAAVCAILTRPLAPVGASRAIPS
jgi:RNase adaptor protein for sRNA GlmZ degradation